MAATFTRSGLHRLECGGCDAYLYGTIAALQSYGLPVCACGEPFTPGRREVAELVGAENADSHAFAAAVARGMCPVIVAAELEAYRVVAARARRFAALRLRDAR